MPSLRDLPSNIAPLAKQFLAKGAQHFGVPEPALSASELCALERYA